MARVIKRNISNVVSLMVNKTTKFNYYDDNGIEVEVDSITIRKNQAILTLITGEEIVMKVDDNDHIRFYTFEYDDDIDSAINKNCIIVKVRKEIIVEGDTFTNIDRIHELIDVYDTMVVDDTGKKARVIYSAIHHDGLFISGYKDEIPMHLADSYYDYTLPVNGNNELNGFILTYKGDEKFELRSA